MRCDCRSPLKGQASLPVPSPGFHLDEPVARDSVEGAEESLGAMDVMFILLVSGGSYDHGRGVWGTQVVEELLRGGSEPGGGVGDGLRVQTQ